MANAYKNLGQSNPAATTSTDLYTVPVATQAIVASIAVCNQAGTAGSFRISVAVAGAALAAKQYLCFDVPIGANAAYVLTAGITLAATDKIRVYASSATMSFNAWGQEIT